MADQLRSTLAAADIQDQTAAREFSDPSPDEQRPAPGAAAEHAREQSDSAEIQDPSERSLGALAMFEHEEVVHRAPAEERGAPADDPFTGRTIESVAVELLDRIRPRRSVVKPAIGRAVSDMTVATSRALSDAHERFRQFNERLRQIVVRRKTQPAKQWALPLLVLVVLVESTWLAIGAFRGGEAGNVATVSTTLTEPKLPSSTENADGQIPSDKAPALNKNGTMTRGTTGTAAAVVPPKSPSAPAPGSLTIAMPFRVEVYESGVFVGIDEGKGIPLNPGSHQLEFVNETLRYRASQKVAVTSGRTTRVTLDLPMGTLHLNATPWAEVFVDGDSIGETPLANVEVPIGPRTIVFRHPRLGEQTRQVLVAAGSTTRLGIDLLK